MKRLSILAAFVLIALAITGLTVLLPGQEQAAARPAAAPTNTADAPPSPAGTSAASVALGAHLVATSGCHDCHTPLKLGNNGPEPDLTRALSGHPESMKLPPPPAATPPWIVSAAATNTAWSGPWGVSFTANLTPDVETGLGAWTEQTFIQTIRSGRHLGRGRAILPPMPIPVYKNFSDQELAAIFHYLHTVPALKNRVPDPLPPAPVKPQLSSR